MARPIFWITWTIVGLAIPTWGALRREPLPKLPVLGSLPDFTLTDQDGRPYGSADLRGKVWVASFIFTRCPTICPDITRKMAKIQHRARNIEPAFRLISFSVDPDFDTPSRLTEYAQRHKASPRMWRMLTGPLDDVKRTIVGGLKIGMGTPVNEADLENVFHGTHFVLVDADMRIRGYYDSSDPELGDNVLQAAAMLINRGY